MKEPFLPFLTLDQIYVSPIVRKEDGSYECMSFDEMQRQPMPQTGSRLMDAVARTLAIRPCRRGSDVAEYLDVDVRKLSAAVSLNFTMNLDELVVAYRVSLACELARFTQLPLDEVAARCGIKSGSTLDHLLQSKLNVTFLDYRNQFQKVVNQKVVVQKS